MYHGRVEGLAAESSASLNFVPLRAAIRSLQFASLKFDVEKFAAERVLERQLRKWRKQRQRPHKRKRGCLKRFIHRLKGIFKRESYDVHVSMPTPENDGNRGSGHEANVEGQGWPHLPFPHWPGRRPHRLPPQLIKAAKVVRKINQKLASFERGFIHEDGIKDREWYRHLGVAPGKWLGKALKSVDVSCGKCLTLF
jgi:N-acetylated-alpha-linked acidic dipeptidase